jgi:hypothetical protein
VLLIELRPGISPVTALRPGSAVVVGVMLAGVLALYAVPFDPLVVCAAFCGVLVLDPVRPEIASGLRPRDDELSPDSSTPSVIDKLLYEVFPRQVARQNDRSTVTASNSSASYAGGPAA